MLNMVSPDYVAPQEFRLSLPSGQAFISVPAKLTFEEWVKLGRLFDILKPEEPTEELEGPPEDTLQRIQEAFAATSAISEAQLGKLGGLTTATEAVTRGEHTSIQLFTERPNENKTGLVKEFTPAIKLWLATQFINGVTAGKDLHAALEKEFSQKCPIARIYTWLAAYKMQRRKEAERAEKLRDLPHPVPIIAAEEETTALSSIVPDKVSMAIISEATGETMSILFERAESEDWPYDETGNTKRMNMYISAELPDEIQDALSEMFDASQCKRRFS